MRGVCSVGPRQETNHQAAGEALVADASVDDDVEEARVAAFGD